MLERSGVSAGVKESYNTRLKSAKSKVIFQNVFREIIKKVQLQIGYNF